MTTTSHLVCEGLERFASYADADRQAWFAMSRRRHFDPDFMLAAYFCSTCHGWHVGNPRKQAAARRNDALS